jgi:hypothetical protein
MIPADADLELVRDGGDQKHPNGMARYNLYPVWTLPGTFAWYMNPPTPPTIAQPTRMYTAEGARLSARNRPDRPTRLPPDEKPIRRPAPGRLPDANAAV